MMEGWQEYKLGRFINVMSGAAFKSEDFVSSGTPIVKIGNIVDGTIKPTNDDSFFPTSALPQYKDYILEENDVLIAMSGNTTCKMGRVPKEYSPSLLNQRVGLIQICDTFSSEISIDYVYHLLMSDIYQRKLWSYATATGQPNLSPRDIKRLKFRKPFFSEQIAIANILSKVDDAIASVQNSIAAAERLKKSLMQNLLTGRMKPDGTFRTPEEFYIDEKFGKVPVGWEVKSIDEISEFVQYGLNISSSDNGQIPMLRMNNIINGEMSDSPLVYVNLNDQLLQQYELEAGDILFNRTNSMDLVGKVGVFRLTGKYVFASYLIRVRVSKENNPYYINLALNSYPIQCSLRSKATPAVSQANINSKSLRHTLIIKPKNKDEQDLMLSKIEEVEHVILQRNDKVKKLERLKKSLMQNLLTGRVSMARS